MNSDLLPENKLSVLMVDDHLMIRESYQRLLKDIDFVGKIVLAASAELAIELLKQQHVDIVLMDNSLNGGMSGINATLWITQHKPDVKVIGISNFGEIETGIQFMINGAKGFFEKGLGVENLKRSLIEVSNNKKYFSDELLNEIAVHDNGIEHFRRIELTERELSVVEYLCQAKSTKYIADKLEVSVRRVEQLINEINAKTGCKTQFQLAAFLFKNNYLSDYNHSSSANVST